MKELQTHISRIWDVGYRALLIPDHRCSVHMTPTSVMDSRCKYWVLCVFTLPPISMTHTEKIFSASVLADTLPKPTLVRLLRVK